jgi:molecular chaperone DnaJ
VETPSKLSARQRQLLEELRELEAGQSESDEGFFGKLKDIWNS